MYGGQRHLLPSGDHTYFQFVYQRLGAARFKQGYDFAVALAYF